MRDVNIFILNEQGAEGIDNDPNTPIARAVERLLWEGKPYKTVQFCYLKVGKSLLRWIGVFVGSVGNRIIFFPGHDFYPDHIKTSRNESAYKKQAFSIDHISLEKDFEHWHLTSKASTKQHLGSQRAGGQVL